MSLIKAIQGIILIWYPQLIKLTLTFYGFRETLLIISGISLHSFPGMVAMVTRNCNKEKKTASIFINIFEYSYIIYNYIYY